MELYYKILADYFARYGYLGQMVDASPVIQDRCYQAICRIKGILEDDTMEDPECIIKIEEIMQVLEGNGIEIESRHDFG